MICGLILLAGLPRASAELRVTTYNTKKRPASTDPGQPDTQNWIGALTAICESESRAGVTRAPDIMALQEIPYTASAFAELGKDPFNSPANIATLLNAIIGVTTYTSMTGTYGDGWITQGYVWNSATVEHLETQMVSIGTRPAVRLKFRPVGYTSAASAFYVYNVHLKAYPDGESRRYGEAQSLRRNSDNNLGDGVSVIYAGDFNFTQGVAGERAYAEMLRDGPGKAIDPELGAEGFFECTYPSSGGGGRLDYLFVTEELVDAEGVDLMTDGYKVVGPTYIEQLGRYDVLPPELKFATDHLPVSADYQHPAWMDADIEGISGPVVVGAQVSVNVTIENVAPATVVTGADELDYSISGTGVVTGTASGSDDALGGGRVHPIALDTATAGLRTGQVQVTSNSPAVQHGSYGAAVNLTVLDHSEGSFAPATNVDQWQVDVGDYVPGTGTQSHGFTIHNLLATAGYTAAMEVLSVSGTGDTDQLETNVAATSIAAGGNRLFQALLHTSSRQGLFTARYTIQVADEDLPGSTDRSDLVLELSGYVAIDGDLDLDRDVDGSDLTLLLVNYDQPGTYDWEGGDMTGDGAVDGSDLSLLLANYGMQIR